MKKVYIAGKITGTTDYADRFRYAADMIEAKGDIPLNPAMLPEGMSAEDYMSMCLPMLLRADVVVLLPGWEDSPGARIEKTLAEYCGKKIIDFIPKEEIAADVVKCKDRKYRDKDSGRCTFCMLERYCGIFPVSDD